MATKKETDSGRYRVLRDCAAGQVGDIVVLDTATAADLTRDGMVSPVEE